MEKNYWPAFGMALMAVCALLFWGGVVFLAAFVGYPVVSVMLVVMTLMAFVTFISLSKWDYIKNAGTQFAKGVGIVLTCTAWSYCLQQVLQTPAPVIALAFALFCSYLSYNTFLRR